MIHKYTVNTEEAKSAMSAAAATTAPNPSSSSSGGGGSSSGGGGGGSGSTNAGPTGPCGACKFLRRKCITGCIFAPYFDAEQGAAHFAAVHKVFGASNISKLLHQIPIHKRLDAVVTICYEAQARLRDPVYGCVAHIFALQQQVVNLKTELAYLQTHLTQLELPTPPAPPPQMVIPPPLSISDLPSGSSVPASYDVSSLFDPMGPSSSWAAMQHQQQAHGLDIRHYGRVSGGGDLQALAQELMHRHGSSSSLGGGAQPMSLSSPPPPHVSK